MGLAVALVNEAIEPLVKSLDELMRLKQLTVSPVQAVVATERFNANGFVRPVRLDSHVVERRHRHSLCGCLNQQVRFVEHREVLAAVLNDLASILDNRGRRIEKADGNRDLFVSRRFDAAGSRRDHVVVLGIKVQEVLRQLLVVHFDGHEPREFAPKSNTEFVERHRNFSRMFSGSSGSF